LLARFEGCTSITANVRQKPQLYILSEETLFQQKRGTIVVPLTVLSIVNPWLYMKTVSKNSDLLSNNITRNLIIILVAALLVAVVIVTSSIIVYNRIYNQW
jgi:hypothetical protein